MPHWIERTKRTVNRVSKSMALAGGAVFLPLAFYMTLDAASRRLGGPFTGVSDEFGAYTLAFGGTWAMAYALANNAHVRIDVMMQLYPRQVRAYLNVVTIGTAALLAGILAAKAWELTYTSFILDAKSYSVLGMPLAYPQGLTAIGFTAFTLQAAIMVVVGCVDGSIYRDSGVDADKGSET